MRELPKARYTFAQWKRAKVAPDYHIEADSHLYSVPYPLVGKHVEVRIGDSTVEIFADSTRVAAHLRSYGSRKVTTDPNHMPETHRRKAEWTPERFIEWAARVGPSTEEFVRALLSAKVHPEHAYRMCFGVLGFQKSVGEQRLEAACRRAGTAGAWSYQSIKSILEKGLDSEEFAQTSKALPLHSNVRGAEYYAKEQPCAN